MKYIGIDLGTTNSTISIAYKGSNGTDINVKTLGVNQVDETGVNMTSSHSTLPSVVYYDEYDTPFVGMYAKTMMSIAPKQVLSKVKRHIGKEGKWTLKNGQSFTPQEVSGIVLSVLRREAEAYYMGESIDSAVITVPASFNLLQQNATKEAAKIAGFDPNKIRLIPEPRAAILDFVNEEQKKAVESRRIDLSTPKNIMVFDIGGGTCDVTIHRVSVEQNHVIGIKDLSISQYTELGGIDFDNLIAQAIATKILKITGVSQKEFKENYTVEIKEEILEFAERAKKVISNSIVSKSRGLKWQDTIGQFKDTQDRYVFTRLSGILKLNQPITLTREEIDQAIRPLLFDAPNSKKNIEQPIQSSFHTSIVPISKSDIDCILLVGGMSYYPTVRERIYEMFDKQIIPVTPVDPMESISRGAAVYPLWKESEGDNVDDGTIYPQNVYINVKRGVPETLVKYGQSLPYKSPLIKNKFYVSGKHGIDYVSDMSLELFTALDPESPKTTTLGNAFIQFKEPVRVGSPLTFEVNVDIERNVTVKAWLSDDETQMVKVTLGEPKLSDSEQEKIKVQIEKMNKMFSH